VKIDIEGYDPRVIDRLLKVLPDRKLFIVFEFTPQRFASHPAAVNYLKQLAKDFVVFDLYYCPNPTRFKCINDAVFDAFVDEVSGRPHGYTDLFLLDRRTPAVQKLQQHLTQLVPEPDATEL